MLLSKILLPSYEYKTNTIDLYDPKICTDENIKIIIIGCMGCIVDDTHENVQCTHAFTNPDRSSLRLYLTVMMLGLYYGSYSWTSSFAHDKQLPIWPTQVSDLAVI